MIDLHNIHQTVKIELDLLNTKLLGVGRLEYKLVHDIVTHVIANGKRVRPILLVLIAKAFGVKDTNAVIHSAFAVEMIHTASLLHDDVVDDTKKRRGKKTANTLWGNKETILVGDLNSSWLESDKGGTHPALHRWANHMEWCNPSRTITDYLHSAKICTN